MDTSCSHSKLKPTTKVNEITYLMNYKGINYLFRYSQKKKNRDSMTNHIPKYTDTANIIPFILIRQIVLILRPFTLSNKLHLIVFTSITVMITESVLKIVTCAW